MEISTRQLADGWQLIFTHPETGKEHCIPARVPGNVELDLARAGLLGDPLPPDRYGEKWVDLVDWEYTLDFDFAGLPAGISRAELRFHGIDTVAVVALNGETILECANMFRSYDVDVTRRLVVGKNHLSVRIAAPEIAARRFASPVYWQNFHP